MEIKRATYQIPKLLNASEFKNNQEFYDWQGNNRYFGKQFSILGDSISTFEGYNPKGYNVFYKGETCVNSGVNEARDTWWKKVIEFFGGELLVNNSWSGSRVTSLPNQNELFPSGCSDERTSSLHIGKIMPDVIIVFLGVNDWASGARTGEETRISGGESWDFDTAYGQMLGKLKTNYPDSEIWCCTLSKTYVSKNLYFKFPHKYAGVHIEEYNDIIRRVAWENECNVVDLYGDNVFYDTMDGSHPTCRGMDAIATAVVRAMGGTEVKRFIDCEDLSESIQFDRECAGAGYVISNMEWYDMYHFNILRLVVERTGEMFYFQKQTVNVGRMPSCDLVLENGKKYISRCQATFLCEECGWFIRDNNSKNGTWLNGERMRPDMRYPLKRGDVIELARCEKLVCII